MAYNPLVCIFSIVCLTVSLVFIKSSSREFENNENWTKSTSCSKFKQVTEKPIKISPTLSSGSFDVTFVSQASLNRWGFMQQIIDFWKGPISIMYYIRPDEVETFNKLKAGAHLRSNIYLDYMIQTNESFYPLNTLRNKAIEHVTTSHYYISDMDIWPSPGTYDAILNLTRSALDDEYLAIIVPAFQIHMMSCSSFDECVKFYRPFFPRTKTQLIQCLRDKRCSTFRPREWLHDYYTKEWYTSDRALIPVKCLKSDTQEPYVVVKRSSHLPKFNESFVNYSYDKVQWLEHLRYLGYRYEILGGGYSVDIPHPPSRYREEFFSSIRKTRIFPMIDLYYDFLDMLNRTVENRAVVHLCKGARINPRRIWFASDFKGDKAKKH